MICPDTFQHWCFSRHLSCMLCFLPELPVGKSLACFFLNLYRGRPFPRRPQPAKWKTLSSASALHACSQSKSSVIIPLHTLTRAAERGHKSRVQQCRPKLCSLTHFLSPLSAPYAAQITSFHKIMKVWAQTCLEAVQSRRNTKIRCDHDLL